MLSTATVVNISSFKAFSFPPIHIYFSSQTQRNVSSARCNIVTVDFTSPKTLYATNYPQSITIFEQYICGRNDYTLFNLLVPHYPGSTGAIKISATVEENDNPSKVLTTLNQSVIVRYRQCMVGEIITKENISYYDYASNTITVPSNVCTACMEGKYSLNTKSIYKCEYCPLNADFCYGSVILVKNGYYGAVKPSNHLTPIPSLPIPHSYYSNKEFLVLQCPYQLGCIGDMIFSLD
jgi:hypothetical protein